MKKSIKTVFLSLFLSILFSSFSMAQMSKNYSLGRLIILNNDSEIKEIIIEVKEKNCKFILRVQSSIYAGKVKLEVYDPNGKKQGNYDLGCQIQNEHTDGNKRKKENVTGQTSLSQENATIGKWKVKIIPQKADGKVKVDFKQEIISKNTIDKNEHSK